VCAGREGVTSGLLQRGWRMALARRAAAESGNRPAVLNTEATRPNRLRRTGSIVSAVGPAVGPSMLTVLRHRRRAGVPAVSMPCDRAVDADLYDASRVHGYGFLCPAGRAVAGAHRSPVVIATLSNTNLVTTYPVDEPVLIADTTRPVTLEPVLERFRLADTVVSVTRDLLDKRVDAPEQLPVLGLPPDVVILGVLVPDKLHRMRSRTEPSPLSNRSMAASSRRAFSGLRSR
jgi:hypothetical protein